MRRALTVRPQAIFGRWWNHLSGSEPHQKHPSSIELTAFGQPQPLETIAR